MATKRGLPKRSVQQSMSDGETSSSSTTPVQNPTIVSSSSSPPTQLPDSHFALKPSNLFISPQTSRETSPSRQWLSPNTILQPKDTVRKLAGQGQPLASTRSASIPADVLSTSPDTSTRRSLSSVSTPLSKPPTSLNEAVNNLWRAQKQQGDSGEGTRGHETSSRPKVLSPSAPRHQQSPPHQSDHETEDSRSKAPASHMDVSSDSTAKTSTSSQSSNPTTLKLPRGFSAHSTLETVDEGDQSISPTHEPSSSASSFMLRSSEIVPEPSISDQGRDDSPDGGDTVSLSRVSTATPRRPQDVKDKSLEPRRESLARSAFPVSRRPHSSIAQTKVRQANDAMPQNMTVETEIVPSIPQNFVNNAVGERSGSGRRDDNGTLRTRTSNETIKPKKEKKKSSKKPASIISGANSTRADLFEAKVASAVDEDTSDSDETFVYESNPPEPRARHHRDHSRTPSVTSMQSIGGERRSGRLNSYLEGPRKLRGKRSMKFASTHLQSGDKDYDSGDGGSTPKASQNKAPSHADALNRHLGAFDRGSGRDYTPSERDSPFSQASRVRNSRGYDFRDLSKPQSMLPSSRASTYRKSEASPYDRGLDNGATERTPLMGSLRSQRTRASRRSLEPSSEQMDFYSENGRNWVARFAGCVLMCITILMVVMGAAAFLFATTKPLFSVNIQQIRNVLASEQEIMLDLLVEAVNPNIVTITVADMDLNIFAKSTHVDDDDGLPLLSGSLLPLLSDLPDVESDDQDTDPRSMSPVQDIADIRGSKDVRLLDSVDRGSDPIEDPVSDPQTMLLGRVREFDSALTFDPSPWRHLAQNSTGELRLLRPGNKTQEGGSEKWENMVQHSFELIVRGVLKYQLPLSSRTFTATVGSSVIVHPEAGIDGGGAMKIVMVRKAYWQA